MLANGTQTDVEKGSNNEWKMWHIKDVTNSPGSNYYFYTPEDAERVMRVKYSGNTTYDWRQRAVYANYESDEDSIPDVTIVK